MGVLAFNADNSLALVTTTPWVGGQPTGMAVIDLRSGGRQIWTYTGPGMFGGVVAQPGGRDFRPLCTETNSRGCAHRPGDRPRRRHRHRIFPAIPAGLVTPPQVSRRVQAAFIGLAVILVVAGLMAIVFAPRPSAPVVSPADQYAPTHPLALPSPTPTTVAAANAQIRATVTGAKPLALPSTIPADWSAVVTNLSSSFFTVAYTSPDRSKEVGFAIVVPNPPPPGPHGSQVHPKFHGDANSLLPGGRRLDCRRPPAG